MIQLNMSLKLCPISLILLICVDISWCYGNYRTGREYEDLIMTHIIFKHGDITPDSDTMKYYPNNPYRNLSYFPFGVGELTLKGKKRSYLLGESLRRRYNRFLGPMFHPDLIEARSSDSDKTQMTLQIILTALFPPNEGYEISRYLDWQPIPYKTIPQDEDKLLAVHKSCPRIFEINQNEVDNKTLQFYKYVSEYVGMEIKNSYALYNVYETIKVQEEQGVPVPYWAKRIWPEPFRRNAVQVLVDISKRALPDITGNLLRKIVEDSKNKISSNDGPKMVLYSGHDFNIIGILAALGAYHGEEIPYTSAVIIEVHQMGITFGIKIFALMYEMEIPKLLNIPNCGTVCPIDDFAGITKEFYMENFCQ